MKILLDTCVWGGAVKQLTESGHDVVWAGQWESDPGDNEILRISHQQQRILATQDKDFGELAIVYRYPHFGIIRLVGFPARQQAASILYVIERYGDELLQGAIITMTENRLRIRRGK